MPAGSAGGAGGGKRRSLKAGGVNAAGSRSRRNTLGFVTALDEADDTSGKRWTGVVEGRFAESPAERVANSIG